MRDAAGHPHPIALLAGQAQYAVRGFWRTPIAAFFTLAVPVVFILAIGLLAGDAVVDEATGVRVTQFATPGMMAFAVAMAAFSSPAMAIAVAREQGVLKRLRGTPLPAWAYLGGRMAAAVAVAASSLTLMVAIAVVAFDVQVFARTAPHALLVVVVASAALSAGAFAVVALARTSAVVQLVTTGSVTLLAFVSDIFLLGGDMPRWLRLVGDVFPLSHLADLLRDALHPFGAPPFAWDDLAVIAAWGIAGAVVALRRFSWQPTTPAARALPADALPADALPTDVLPTDGAPTQLPTRDAPARRPGWPALIAGQVRYAHRSLLRDTGSLFFAIAFPVLLVLLLPAVFGQGELEGYGLPLIQVLCPAMIAYGVSVHAFVNVPEQVARARDDGVLTRLRGTPLPPAAYLLGRLGSVLLIAALVAAACLAAAVLVWDLPLVAARLPVVLVVLLVGTTSTAVLGAVVVALAPTATAVPAVALGLLLPMSFVSDVFTFGPLPPVLQAVGWAFPLKPFAVALRQALDPSAVAWAWPQLGLLLAWGLVGGVVAARTFRWGRRPSGEAG